MVPDVTCGDRLLSAVAATIGPLTLLGKKPLIFLTILLNFLSFSTSRDTLTTTQSLSDGETLISDDGTFALGFFTPSYSNNNNRYVGIWYLNIPVDTVIWVANRRHPINGTAGKLFITNNGTLGITDGNSSIIWSSTLTLEVTNPIARLLDTGNFVVTSGDDLNNFSWQSFDYPTDTFVPGMKLGRSWTSGLNCNLTAWSSPTDPSPGNFTFAMDLHGDPQMILWEGSKRIIRSGPWTGLAFSGLLPYNPSYTTTFAFHFVNNKEETYYTMNVIDSSTLTRMVMNQSGILQQFVLLDSGQWGLYWHSPSTQCDSYLACGPYGAVCDTDGSPMCSCLQGFLPKKPADWALRDWSSGCIRKTKLDCRNGTDGFVTVKQALLPDTVSATVDMTKSLDECRSECLRNCSCTAFASADTRGGGNGCIIWSTEISDILVYSNGGQDFYMRLGAADMGSISQNSGHPILAVVLSVILGTVLLLVSAIYFIWRRRKQFRGTTSISEERIAENTEQDEMELPLFDLVAIEAATSNFSDRNKLGEGGFGPVYMVKICNCFLSLTLS
ncbi:uncharacterized protein A4U43_C03F8930 [Asparagus officinalis]|uniref:Apple domain-containing protein n=1 Tax=Asparagus officinalis TaxID=4686 RepID=A0A5P1FDI7_ASPOF|nr:uncharacterized protein A4U43_C03F8930 [Asparagus officinalis]